VNQKIDEGIGKLDQKIGQELKGVSQKIDEGIEKLDQKIGQELSGVNQKIEKLEAKLDATIKEIVEDIRGHYNRFVGIYVFLAAAFAALCAANLDAIVALVKK
jgi:archaellum component FlaC